MRIKTGRDWSPNSPRRGEPLGAAVLQLRDGETVGSIEGTLADRVPTKRTAPIDRPRQLVVR